MITGAFVVGALTVFIGAIATALLVDYPVEQEAGAVGAAVVASLGLLWPVVGPFLEVKRLAGECQLGNIS